MSLEADSGSLLFLFHKEMKKKEPLRLRAHFQWTMDISLPEGPKLIEDWLGNGNIIPLVARARQRPGEPSHANLTFKIEDGVWIGSSCARVRQEVIWT